MKKTMYIFLISLLSFGLWQSTNANSVYAEQSIAQKNVRMHIEEMNCQLCVYLVNKELRNVEGVISTKANMKTREVNIITNVEVKEQSLIEAIEKLKYRAKILQ